MTGWSPKPHARYSGYVGTGEKTLVPRADVHCNCNSSIVYKFRGYRQLLFYSDSLFFCCFILLVFLFFFIVFIIIFLPTILDAKTNDDNDDGDRDGHCAQHEKKVIIKPNCAYNGIALKNTAHNKIRTRTRPRQRGV